MNRTMRINVLAFVSFLIGTSQFAVSGFLDQLVAAMHMTIAAAGQFNTAYALAYALGTPVIIRRTARMDRRTLMLLALSFFSIGNLITALFANAFIFAMSRVIVALGSGTAIVAALTIAARIAVKGKKGQAMAKVTVGFTLALILGIPAGRMLSAALGWQSVFLVITGFGLLAVLVICVTVPNVCGGEPVALSKQLCLLKNQEVVAGLLITLFWLGGYAVIYLYISPYLLKGLHLPAGYLTAALLVFGIACFIGSKIGGYCVDHFGLIVTLSFSMVVNSLTLSLLAMSDGHPLCIFLFLFLWSAAVWCTQPAQLYHLATVMPEQSGLLLGLNQSVSQLAMAGGAAIGGDVISARSIGSLTMLGNLGVGLALLIVWRLYRLKRHAPV
ncbi:MAG: MFS transporter [Sporolactobacillus sp.]